MRVSDFVTMSVASILLIACTQRLGGDAAHPAGQESIAMHEHIPSSRQTSREPSLIVVDEATARLLTVRRGPIDIPAGTPHEYLADRVFTIPFDGWLTSLKPRVIDASGRSLPRRLLHHLDFYNASRRDLLCPGEMEILFSTGSELQPWQLPPGTGLRLRKGDDILIRTMVENLTKRDFPNTFVEVRMSYTLDSEQSLLTSVYPMVISLFYCRKGLSVYDLKPGVNVATSEIMGPYSGRLLAVGGHVHDYARELKLENLTRRETIATLIPQFDDQGRFLSLPIISLAEHGGYKIEHGDTLRLTSTYENPTDHVLTEAAMAGMIGAFLPDNEEDLPSVMGTAP